MSTDLRTRTVLIGGGRMARAIIAGLRRRTAGDESITVIEPSAQQRQALVDDFAVIAVAELSPAIIRASDLVVICVKPPVVPGVCQQIRAHLERHSPVIVSIAAGVLTTSLARWLGDLVPIVRAMPNIPAQLGVGITGLFAPSHVNDASRLSATQVFQAVGTTVWLEREEQIDALTAISGSGPAYVFCLANAMEQAAMLLNLAPPVARQLVQHTVFGAARMLLDAAQSPAQLCQQVTSPEGTTQAAIEQLQAGQFNELINRAIQAAAERSTQLAQCPTTHVSSTSSMPVAATSPSPSPSAARAALLGKLT